MPPTLKSLFLKIQQNYRLLFLWIFLFNLGFTLNDLRNDPKLTPEKFAKYFADFEFEFHSEVQDPATFISRKAGDCDDFAILADLILREKGYHTRLIAVRMPGLTHVVCYVEETKSYLDFNNRIYLKRTVSCGNSIQEIADKVAKSLGARWTSASEFTYKNGIKQMVATVSQTERYITKQTTSSPPQKVESRKIIIDF